LSPVLLQVLSTLEQISTDFPILILNQSNVTLGNFEQSHPASNPQSERLLTDHLSGELEKQIQELMTKLDMKILPSQISMSDLLEQIKQVLHDNTDLDKP
jgi:hypothetical protein